MITVNNTAPHCRPRNAKRLMKYKHASTISNRQETNEDYLSTSITKPHLTIKEWSVADIECDKVQLGLNGSPTKVKKVDNIVFQSKESRSIEDLDEHIDELMQELISSHIIG